MTQQNTAQQDLRQLLATNVYANFHDNNDIWNLQNENHRLFDALVNNDYGSINLLSVKCNNVCSYGPINPMRIIGCISCQFLVSESAIFHDETQNCMGCAVCKECWKQMISEKYKENAEGV